MTQKDPVCNMMIDEKNAQHTSEINEQKIYLCSAHCKSQFDKNPSKYGY
jgi:YHS domain-containing protein